MENGGRRTEDKKQHVGRVKSFEGFKFMLFGFSVICFPCSIFLYKKVQSG